MQLMELMDLCTKSSDRVLDLENVKDAQALEIQKLKKRVKKLEKKRKSRTSQLKRRLFKVRIDSSAKTKDAKSQGRYGHDTKINTASTSITTASIYITTAKDVTTVNALVTTAGVSVSTTEPSTPPPTTTSLIEDEDLIIAKTLMKMRSVTSKEKSKEKGVSSTRLTRGVIMKEASETVSRPIVPPQQQLDLKDKGKEVLEGSGKKAKSSGKEAVSKKRTEEEFNQESYKRQKTSENSKLAEEPRDKEADELDDLLMLWSLVKKKFNSTEPTCDKEREIWLYNSCGVHHVSTEKGIYIYMLVEKEYRFSRGTLSLMLVAKLLMDQDNEMSKELLRKIFIQAERLKR
nr:hypothetical protein [Tanacetum cinerariifolium]